MPRSRVECPRHVTSSVIPPRVRQPFSSARADHLDRRARGALGGRSRRRVRTRTRHRGSGGHGAGEQPARAARRPQRLGRRQRLRLLRPRRVRRGVSRRARERRCASGRPHHAAVDAAALPHRPEFDRVDRDRRLQRPARLVDESGRRPARRPRRAERAGAADRRTAPRRAGRDRPPGAPVRTGRVRRRTVRRGAATRLSDVPGPRPHGRRHGRLPLARRARRLDGRALRRRTGGAP